jgi:hypothetical protein
VQAKRASGQNYSVFSTGQAGKKSYLAERAAGYVRCPMSERGEEMFSMISGLTVFAALCVAALLFFG